MEATRGLHEVQLRVYSKCGKEELRLPQILAGREAQQGVHDLLLSPQRSDFFLEFACHEGL